MCRTELVKLCKNFNILSKVRVLDRFQYKLERERSESKIFITIFPHYNLLIKHFFLPFHEQTIFFPLVAEQTIYFKKFAEQSFFSQKTMPPPQESNGRPLNVNTSLCKSTVIFELSLLIRIIAQ